MHDPTTNLTDEAFVPTGELEGGGGSGKSSIFL